MMAVAGDVVKFVGVHGTADNARQITSAQATARTENTCRDSLRQLSRLLDLRTEVVMGEDLAHGITEDDHHGDGLGRCN